MKVLVLSFFVLGMVLLATANEKRHAPGPVKRDVGGKIERKREADAPEVAKREVGGKAPVKREAAPAVEKREAGAPVARREADANLEKRAIGGGAPN